MASQATGQRLPTRLIYHTSPGKIPRHLPTRCRAGPAAGLHVFLYDNIYHAVYSTNYLMRVVDVLITKPSELAFYPVPKIFNERVGGHEAWGAIRGAELGDGTIEMRSIPRTLQAIDLLAHERDLLELFCDCNRQEQEHRHLRRRLQVCGVGDRPRVGPGHRASPGRGDRHGNGIGTEAQRRQPMPGGMTLEERIRIAPGPTGAAQDHDQCAHC